MLYHNNAHRRAARLRDVLSGEVLLARSLPHVARRPASALPVPIERSREGQDDPEIEAVRGYCLAVRSALTDTGRPPLDAPGLTLRSRLQRLD
jgi:hypothetical protein